MKYSRAVGLPVYLINNSDKYYNRIIDQSNQSKQNTYLLIITKSADHKILRKSKQFRGNLCQLLVIGSYRGVVLSRYTARFAFDSRRERK